jgi:hypothetical protein
MQRISIVTVLALLSTECHAQNAPTTGQCNQVRAAIAQHGLQAARKHAMQHYGLTLTNLLKIEQDCGVHNRGRAAPPMRRP